MRMPVRVGVKSRVVMCRREQRAVGVVEGLEVLGGAGVVAEGVLGLPAAMIQLETQLHRHLQQLADTLSVPIVVMQQRHHCGL